MAISGNMYAPTLFQLAVLPETTLGTINGTSMKKINLLGMPTLTRPAVRDYGIKHGTCQIADKDNIYVNQVGQTKEIGFTALYDTTIAPILISNCMGVAVGTSPASYDLAYNYTSVVCKHGDTDTDSTGALTVRFINPDEDYSEIFPGCFVDTFRMYANVNDDGGRFKMDVVLKTRYNSSHSYPVTSATYASAKPYTGWRTIFDLYAKKSIGQVDMVLSSFDLTLNSQVKFYGYGLNGIPETMGRGFPEFLATGKFDCKLDENSQLAHLSSVWDETDVAVELSNNATWASATFGIKGDYGQITNDLNLGEFEGGVFVPIELKWLADSDTAGDVLQIVP